MPLLGANLFSIASATKAGIEVHFTGDRVTFSHQGKIEMVGQRTNNALYYLDMQAKDIHLQEERLLLAREETSLSTWHQRLAHSNYGNIKNGFDKCSRWNASCRQNE